MFNTPAPKDESFHRRPSAYTLDQSFDPASFGAMKESKPAAATYKLRISQSGIEPELTSSSPSLTELVRLAHAFVPGMDKYQKVYSETRKNLGGYVRLFVFVVGKSEYRRITVSIELDKIFPADLARFLRKEAKKNAPAAEITGGAEAGGETP